MAEQSKKNDDMRRDKTCGHITCTGITIVDNNNRPAIQLQPNETGGASITVMSNIAIDDGRVKSASGILLSVDDNGNGDVSIVGADNQIKVLLTIHERKGLVRIFDEDRNHNSLSFVV